MTSRKEPHQPLNGRNQTLLPDLPTEVYIQPWKQLFSEHSSLDVKISKPLNSKETWIEAYEADDRVASAGTSTGLQASVKTNMNIKSISHNEKPPPFVIRTPLI